MLRLENLLSQGDVERLGWMLVHFLWQAAGVAMLLAVFLRLLRQSSANIRYLTACAALALMVVLPLATMQFIEVPGPAAEAGSGPRSSVTAAPLPTATAVPMPGQTFALSDVPLETAAPTIPVPWGERIASVLEPALPYVVLGWLVGVFGLSAWHLGGWMQLQRLKRRTVHGVAAALQQRLARIAGRLGVRQAVTLLESALVEVPTVVSWLRPAILLPASALTGLSPEQLEAILAHELAHIRRYDYLVNVLQTVVEILGFYHPAVWWVSRRIRIERENCCDDAAVRLCGDSVRYARALTCLEEIRHSQTELAMAATGGSLLDRIARLLGRSATDDRRFAWLPGLITLLLVIGVVIPAALTLGESIADRSEPPSADVAASIREAQDTVQTNEPNRVQILLDFIIAEAFSDATLDRDTATKVVDLLARLPAGNARLAVAADAPPSMEELQQPLADVLARFAPKPGKSRHLVDWLVSKGYAYVICNPRLEVFAGQQASIVTGDMPDPNATQPENREFALMRLNVTANEVQDQNATRLEIDFVRTYPTYRPGEPNKETTTSAIQSTLAAPNNQYTSITDRMMKRVDENGRERLVLALVRSAIVRSPEASPSRMAAPEPNAPRVDLTAEASNEPNATGTEKALVAVNVRIIRAVDSNELDGETVMQIEKILGKRVRPQGPAGEFGPRLHLTVGEVLREHVVQQPLPGETVDALLQLLGSSGRHLEVLSSPRVVAWDGARCQIRIGREEYLPTTTPTDGSSQPERFKRVEVGTKVDLTPHVGDHNDVTMEIMVEMTDVLPHSDGVDMPIVSTRSVQATVTVPSGQYFTLAGLVAPDTQAQAKNRESLYIMAMPAIMEPGTSPDAMSTGQTTETRHIRLKHLEAEPAKSLLSMLFPQHVKSQAADSTDPNSRDLIVTAPAAMANRVVAEIERIDTRPRQVLLDTRVVSMERRDLSNLDIEWTRGNTHPVAPGSAVESGARVGRLPDRVSWDSFNAELRPLIEDNRVDTLSHPHVMAKEGRQSRIQVIIESYGFPPSGSIDYREREDGNQSLGMLITPYINDEDDINLSIAWDIRKRVYGRGDPNSPIVGPDTPRNTITVHDGGTAVLATPETNLSESDDSKRIVVFFITAKLVHDPNSAPS